MSKTKSCSCPRVYPSSSAAIAHYDDCPNKPEIRVHDGYINEITKLQSEIAELKQQLKAAREEGARSMLKFLQDENRNIVNSFDSNLIGDWLATKEPTK